MTDILCCKACGHALTIVCPEHGTDWVPDRRMGPTAPLTPEPPKTQKPPRGRRAQIVRAVEDGHQTAPAVAAACEITLGHAYVELSNLVKAGVLFRPRARVYALLTMQVRP